MSFSVNEGLRFSLMIGVVTLVLVASTMSVPVTCSLACNGTVNFPILYQDGVIRNVSVNAVSAFDVTNTPTTVLQRFRFTEHEPFAGENGIEIDGHHVQLIPGGKSGGCSVHLFNYTTETWSTIDVYCPPLGLSYRRDVDEIVGFCAVNTTNSLTCVPYFKLHIQDGQWVDVSRPGSCSQLLSTTNITNPVILQSDSDYEYDETRLYFAEKETNRLHEVSLSAGEATYYETDATLKIDHLVPVSNASFFGLRVVCYHLENSFNFYHKLFLWQLDSTQQQQTGFVEESVQTESVAFDSYNLDYLVTFNANRNTVIISKDGRSQYYQHLPTLDYPIRCQNLAEPSTHYLICLAGNGYLPLLINLTGDAVANKSLARDEPKKVIRAGVLARDTFYLLTNQQELSVCLLTSTVWCLEPYTVRANIDFIITAASSDINCTVHNCTATETQAENIGKSHSTSAVVFILPAIVVIIIIIGSLIVYWIVRKKLKKNDHYIAMKNAKSHQYDEQFTVPNGEQKTTNQSGDSTGTTCDNDTSSNSPLKLVESDSNNGLPTGPVSLGAGPNDERIVYATENDSNLVHAPQEADTCTESEVVFATVANNNSYIIRIEAPAENCDTKRKNFELDSNQPEKFVEAKSEMQAIECTHKSPSMSVPPPDTERYS